MDEDWVRWTRNNFARPLRSLLRPALGDVRIFLDEQIETGASWPARLAAAHTRSRLLIPILSRDYFNSEWCRLELTLMYEREKLLGFRTPVKPHVLILPFVIDDGDCFPSEVQAMQGEKIHQFANPCMCTDTPRQEAFAEHLRQWCPRVEQALQSVPPFDPSWEGLAQDQFSQMFQIKFEKVKTLPGLSLLPNKPGSILP
jgi:hypothetical protein